VSTLKIFSYARCSTCRKALLWLDSNRVHYELVDITLDPPDRSRLARALDQLERRQLLINTSGQSYRALGAGVVKAMSDEQVLDALAADGRLIKRPFVELQSGQFLVGFKPEVWSQVLLS